MYSYINLVPGVLLCLAIAIPAWFFGKAFPLVGGPVAGIITGMVISAFSPAFARGGSRFSPGIRYTSKKLLQFSIILLGFEMNLFNIIKVGGQSVFVMLFTLAAAFIAAYAVGRVLKLQGNTSILIGVGTAICGGSAIAATAPVIKAKDDDVVRSISTIFLFNIIAVFIFPALGHIMGMSDTGFGMWAGTAINDTSSVVAAGTAWSGAAGNNTALWYATIVKLTRTLMIVPVTLALAVYTARKSGRQNDDGGFSFIKVFPWFVIAFVAAACINTFAGIPAEVSKELGSAGKFVIVMAMAAIGLNTNLKTLVSKGFSPIMLGLCCWVAVAVTALIVQKIMGI